MSGGSKRPTAAGEPRKHPQRRDGQGAVCRIRGAGGVRILALVAVWAGLWPAASAQSFDVGGTARYYQFFRIEDLPEFLQQLRRDTEFGSFRTTLDAGFGPKISLETHAVLDVLSPPVGFSDDLVAGGGSPWLPLQKEFSTSDKFSLVGRFDRLKLQADLGRFRLDAGRQAITWGVTYFWSPVDLLSTFAPERIDRDYKDGVDALRGTVDLGTYTELQIVGAVLGRSFERDKTLAAQLRTNLGPLDVGLMGGSFHGDAVAGGFVTSDVAGTALRGEVTWTRSGDAADAEIDRSRFWRASVGVDRQLAVDVTLTVEFAFNGFGVTDSDLYPRWLGADRIQRGETNGVGRYYSGASVGWQAHPLWTFSNALLVNLADPSAFWIPAVEWSTSDNSSLLFGGQVGIGNGFAGDNGIGSEYGVVPATVFVAGKIYF